jgi:uncharacterized membrane protein YeaQ/YmgE (transglycosylase-associated protein family)
MALLSWILVGLALGFIAKWVTRRNFGFLWTMVAGLAGAVIGGLIGRLLGFGGVVNDFSIWSFLIAIAVSVVALIILNFVLPGRRRRRN